MEGEVAAFGSTHQDPEVNTMEEESINIPQDNTYMEDDHGVGKEL